VLFISDTSGTHELWRLRDTELTTLPLPFEFGFRRFEISQNGEAILFERKGVLYEFDLISHAMEPLILEEHKAYVANYHTDQNKIIYSSNKTGQWQLWQFDKTSKKHLQLTQHGGYSGYLANGKLIYSKRNQPGLWQYDEGQEQLLIEDFENINWLNWRVINNKVYFYRPGSGIWQFELDTKVEQLIMQATPEFLHQYTVSKDESSIIFSQLQPLQGDIQALVF